MRTATSRSQSSLRLQAHQQDRRHPELAPAISQRPLATTAGTAANVVGTSPVILGTAAGITAAGAVAATIAGEPIKGTKQIASEVADSAGAAIEWVADWF